MKNEKGYIDSFSKLIQCPTVTNSGHEYFDKFHKVLDEEFPNVTSTCEKIEIGRDVLLYRWKGKKSDKPIVLMAHQDVVPAVGGNWKYDPYGATVDGGKIYGRGTMDCKNTLFSTIQACEELISEGFVPEQDVYLSYSDCEETSGPGAEMARDYFVSKDIHPGICIDEGGAIAKSPLPIVTRDLAMVGIQEKGYMDVKFIAKGKGGHSSEPPTNTPIARLAKCVNYCEKHTVFKPKAPSAAVEMIYNLGSNLKQPLKALCHTIKWSKGLVARLSQKINVPMVACLFKTSMVFTMSQAAAAPNIIPQEAWVNANLRLSPFNTCKEVEEKLSKIAKKFDCEIEVVQAREASPMVDLTTKEYKCYADSLNEVYPEVGIVPYYISGGTDCRTLQTICNTAIRCTPCKLSMDQIGAMHADNENLDVDALDRSVLFFKTFIKKYN